MMISLKQIKAARAMLDLTQDGLAQMCGLSLNTIYGLENGNLSARSSFVVRKALESKGLEFLGANGVCLRDNVTRTYQGPDGPDKYYEELLAGAKENGGGIAAVFWSQDMLIKSFGITNSDRLERLEQLAKYSRVKCLLVDVRELTLDIPFFEFRTMTNYHGFHHPTITTNNRSAIIMPNVNKDFVYFVVEDVETAQQNWNEFLPFWNNAATLAMPSSSRKRRA